MWRVAAYPRYVEFEKFREIADTVGAYLMADIAHPSGLIVSGVHPSPWPFCHVATSTTHKTLRGPKEVALFMVGEDFRNTWGITAPKFKDKMISEIIDGIRYAWNSRWSSNAFNSWKSTV